jgi:putative ABC transport system ATP-binding protein
LPLRLESVIVARRNERTRETGPAPDVHRPRWEGDAHKARPERASGALPRVEILRGVDLVFDRGPRYVVIGPSGAGKSTLLRLLNRLEDPDEGRVSIGETPIGSLPVRLLRRSVGLVFQNPRPLPGTVFENMIYPHEIVGAMPPDAGRLAEALAEVGLDPDWLDRDAGGLSGGERQRLALAVALQAKPEILALDEPTAGLDPAAARRVAEVLAHRSLSEGLRTIAVTHHREHAAWLGDVALVLEAGRVVDQGPVSEVLARVDQAIWAGSDPERGRS